MGIIAQRPPADKPGEDIVDSVLTSEDSQLERGTYEVNHSANDRILLSGSVMRDAHIQPGSMVSINNQGRVSVGLVTEYSGSLRFGKALSVRQQIKVETIA